MATPVKVNFKIYQGSTFREVVRWESNVTTYKPITGITKSAPMVVTAVGHGIPLGWRAKIVDVVGMKEVNSSDNYLLATGTTTDTVTFNSVNSSSYTAYTSGGTLYYAEPASLSGITARMQIRAKLNSSSVLDELTTENGKIVLDNATKTITLLVSATDTAAYTFSSAVYSLEVISGVIVTPLIYGNITLDKEITR
jgi:hypothetical protein